MRLLPYLIMKYTEIIQKIEQTAIKFFSKYTNLDENSTGYGLTIDNTNDFNVATIAGSGFMLSGLIIADTRGYLERSVAVEIARKTLKNFYENIDHYEGFFIHFADFKTGKRYKVCEYSTVDTMLFLCGAIAVDSYFHDEVINVYFNKLIKRINFPKFIHDKNGKPIFYMAYNPDHGGQYVKGDPGFIHHWSMFAEQLPLYVIYAGLGYENALEVYQSFQRKKGSYKDIEYIYTPGNALFVYQYPLAFLDLENITDNDGINWHNNAKKAILSHQQLSIDISHIYPTFNQYAFGFTSGMTKSGYQVFRGLPNIENQYATDGTVHPNAVVGSLSIADEIAVPGVEYLYQKPKLFQEYGFVGGYNESKDWIADCYLSIDKGLEMLMANAYLSNDVRRAFMSHEIIVKGLKKLKWR
jgi:hypothetical protein